MRVLCWCLVVAVLSAGCSGQQQGEAAGSLPSSTVTTLPLPTSSTSRPVSSSQVDEVTTLWPVDAATLQRSDAPAVVPGQVGWEYAVVPDGRLVLLSWDFNGAGHTYFSVVDPVSMATASYDMGIGAGGSVLGYSEALDRVVLIGGSALPRVMLFDPDDGSVEDIGGLDRWYSSWTFLGGGSELGLYTAQWDEVEPPPPVVSVVTLPALEMVAEVRLDDVHDGPVPIPAELASDPSWPYALLTPGVTWDPERRRVFVAHADGSATTVVDLDAATTRTVRHEPEPSLWARALAWLIPPAAAKGGDAARRTAWLTADGSRLLSVAVQEDEHRDPTTGRLTSSEIGLGARVVDTDTLEVIGDVEDPVSRGALAPTGSAWVLAGGAWTAVWCDEVCDPSHSDPAPVDSQSAYLGLYLLDPMSLAVLHHLGDGANYYPIGFTGNQLLVERFGPDGDFYESIDVTTGATTGSAPFADSSYMPTPVGLFEVIRGDA